MHLSQHRLYHESKVYGFYLREARFESAPEHKPSWSNYGRFSHSL